MATTTDGLGLDEQICFALYTASRAMTARYRPILEPLGLTYPQYLVMLALWERYEATVGELGRALQLDSGTLSPLLKRLEGMGLVERRRSIQDERAVIVSLSAAGADLRAQAVAVPQAMCDVIGIGLDDRGELVSVLNDLAVRLRGEEPTDG